MAVTSTNPQLADSEPAGEDVCVRVRDLVVTYRVFQEQRLSMRQLAARGFRSRQWVDVHALRGVSFDAAVGEAVGIVGSNGSGKSTLLRTIAGLQAKESGVVLARGEPRILGVNAVLKAELSGHRNVILGGLAMGLGVDEVEAKMDEVIEFSGLASAIGRPMSTYSSGMAARLAFSIATLTTPDVLLIDEALAVGDRDFRKRSLERVNQLREEASTVLMVTHNLNEIRETCGRAIWLDDGTVRADGEVTEVLTQYEESGR